MIFLDQEIEEKWGDLQHFLISILLNVMVINILDMGWLESQSWWYMLRNISYAFLIIRQDEILKRFYQKTSTVLWFAVKLLMYIYVYISGILVAEWIPLPKTRNELNSRVFPRKAIQDKCNKKSNLKRYLHIF